LHGPTSAASGPQRLLRLGLPLFLPPIELHESLATLPRQATCMTKDRPALACLRQEIDRGHPGSGRLEAATGATLVTWVWVFSVAAHSVTTVCSTVSASPVTLSVTGSPPGRIRGQRRRRIAVHDPGDPNPARYISSR